ncbi:MAG: transglycosylase domain-containing protein [Bacteroidetes bacterium]|nr:transglycosylase domain-containing protein [Bacteroidota bacterium]
MKRSVRIFWYIFFAGFICCVLIIMLANFGAFGKMPSLKELENPSILQSSEVYASDGTLMGRYYRERGNRSNIEYKDISKNVINALVSTEDKRFYDHSGIDFKSTLRAVFLLGQEGGGSTITQQLAKTLLDQGSKNKAWRIIEKVKPYIIAIKLERNFTKEEILALYLNAVPFSDNVYGIRNASRTFFQKEPDRLDVDEAALLIGMLKGNTLYNPRRNYKAAFDRRNVVITQMEVNNKLTHVDADKLRSLPIKLNYRKMDENNGYAPYFREVLKGEITDALKDVRSSDGSPYNIYDDGLRIYTTINPKMQVYAEEAVAQWMPVLQKAMSSQNYLKNVWKDHQAELDRYMKQSDRWQNMSDDGYSEKEIRKSFTEKVPMKVFAWNANREKDTIMTPLDSIKYSRQMLQSSFMCMDPITGEVKAWVGGISFKTYKYDHANLKTKRQVGSTIKPLLYCQAMEERGFTPETICDNEAQYFPGNGWVPAGRKCVGAAQVTMAGALAHSLNCASAYIMKNVGAPQFADFLSRLNLPTKVDVVPALALGACDLSLYEMLWGYSIFAGRGFSTKPYFITRIEDRNGNVIKRFDYSSNRKEVVSEATAYRMARMMQGTVDVGTAAGLRGRLGISEMGGKTGTTNDNADFWFMGYTPQLLAGTWVGCDDRFLTLASSAYAGGRVARPVWEYFFQKVLADKSLGIEKDARFVVPADYENITDSSSEYDLLATPVQPGLGGEDEGVGKEQDFKIGNEYIPPESKPVIEEKVKVKTDTSALIPKVNKQPVEEPKKKKGLFKRLFGKKEKN